MSQYKWQTNTLNYNDAKNNHELRYTDKQEPFPNRKSASLQNKITPKSTDKKGALVFSWFFRIVASVIFATMIVGLIVGAALVGWANLVIKDTPPLSAENIYQHMEHSTMVYDNRNSYLTTIESPIHRSVIPYEEIPDLVKNAFIAIEDERFWDHPGFDLQRIIGVIWLNYREGTRQGASTLNQQLAKNLFLTTEQTYERKLRDIHYGIQLQQQLTKEEILEAYLNHVYLGRGAYGVQAAAEVYFGKNASELTLAEASYLATIPRNPSRYALTLERSMSSVSSDETIVKVLEDDRVLVPNWNAHARQTLVLDAMLRNELITQREYDETRETPLESLLVTTDVFGFDYSWFFMDMVQNEAIKVIMSHYQVSRLEALNMLLHGGFKIQTTLDQEKQKIVEAYYADNNNFPGYRPEVNQPQSAFVLYDHHTGEIKALVGGRNINEGRTLFNRAIEPRQPGSAMKAIAAFFPALEHGFSPDSTIMDEPIRYDLDDPTRIWPRNWYAGYRGRMTLTQALAQSSNVAGVNLLGHISSDHNYNLSVMRDSLMRLGVSSFIPKENAIRRNNKLWHDEVYSTVLGGMTYGISPLEMASAFGTFANAGVRQHPTVIQQIVDRDGNEIYSRKESVQVTSAGVSHLMTEMLVASVSTGTGRRAALQPGNQGIPVAGKTGTTTSMRDAWFVGYTPYYTATVWVGNDMNEDLVQGSAMAAQIWSDVMRPIHEGLESKSFETPTDIVVVGNARYAEGYESRSPASGWQPAATAGSSPDQSDSGSSGSVSGSPASSSSEPAPAPSEPAPAPASPAPAPPAAAPPEPVIPEPARDPIPDRQAP